MPVPAFACMPPSGQLIDSPYSHCCIRSRRQSLSGFGGPHYSAAAAPHAADTDFEFPSHTAGFGAFAAGVAGAAGGGVPAGGSASGAHTPMMPFSRSRASSAKSRASVRSEQSAQEGGTGGSHVAAASAAALTPDSKDFYNVMAK